MRDIYNKNINSISCKYRKKRFEFFLSTLRVKVGLSILDVGGYPYFWEGSGLEKNVTILNINLPNKHPKPYRWIRGNACKMDMIEDGLYDIVFSNSVLEHVGNFKRQQLMANEIQRVGGKYWIQTPYKHFPIEPHFIFPFYQYLPHGIRRAIALHWPFSYAKFLGLDPIFEAEHVWLLNRFEMQSLFPDAQIFREKLLGLTKSLIAVRT